MLRRYPAMRDTTPTVRAELDQIPSTDRREAHQGLANVLLLERPDLAEDSVRPRIQRRAAQLSALHPGGENDCRFVAESEAAGVAAALTFDNDLVSKLRNATSVDLCSPTEYWDSHRPEPGSLPIRVPAFSNPLSSAPWWRC